MFWLGQILAFLALILSLNFLRSLAIKKFPKLNVRYLEMSLLFIGVGGIVISSYLHIVEVNELSMHVTVLEAVHGYSDVAKLNVAGVTGKAGAYLTETTAISRLLEGTVVEDDNGARVRCDEQSLSKYRAVIREYPTFPFSYRNLAVCLREKSDLDWQSYAEEALEIFEKTTALADHHISHNEAKQELEEYLEWVFIIKAEIGGI